MSYYTRTPKPVKIKNEAPIPVKLSGGRWLVVVAMSVFIAIDIGGISTSLRKSNELKEDELKIRKEQLDLARRQFQLDSITAVQNQKIR